MISNDSPRHEMNEKRAFRENQQAHFDIISKSIGKIVKNTDDAVFKSDVCKLLNVKIGQRKKTVETEVMKRLKANYHAKIQTSKRQASHEPNPKRKRSNSNSNSVQSTTSQNASRNSDSKK